MKTLIIIVRSTSSILATCFVTPQILVPPNICFQVMMSENLLILQQIGLGKIFRAGGERDGVNTPTKEPQLCLADRKNKNSFKVYK